MTPLAARLSRRLFAVDVLTLGCAAALAAVAAVAREWVAVATCGLILAGIPAVAWLRAHTESSTVAFLHDWILVPVIGAVYLSVGLTNLRLHEGRTIDEALVAADRWLCGTDPTVWLARFSAPWLTETLQMAYASFYLLPLLVGAECYARRDDAGFRGWALAAALGFYLSYAGYLLLPAVGPGLALHDPRTLSVELPGLWLTPWLRSVIGAGGLVHADLPREVAITIAMRDAFPSGHTLIAVLAIWRAWRHRMALRWPVTVAGSLLVVATVYLRYHYVVDVIAGAACAAAVIAASGPVQRGIARRWDTMDRDLLIHRRPTG